MTGRSPWRRSCRLLVSSLAALAAGVFALTIGVTPAHASTGSVTVNLNNTTLQGTPQLFGGTKFPQQAQAADVLPKMAAAGVNRIRTDMYLEHVLPTTTVAGYLANTNDVQDPATWNWTTLWGMDQARAKGIKTMFIVDYTPAWLSYSGTRTGVPDNWTVWEDIVKKVYEKYASDVGWIEVWNEPDSTSTALDLAGSPYTSEEAALADIYYHTVQAIRSAGSTVPIGGFAFANNETGSLQTILSDLVAAYGQVWVDQNFDFYSFHNYGSNPGGSFDAGAIRSIFTANGLSASTPIYVDEYNITANWQGTEPELYTDAAVGYIGKTLAKFVQQGVGGDYFSFYPYDYTLSNTVYEDGDQTSLAFYYVTGNGTTGTLFSQANPMRILSLDLGLGDGTYAVKSVSTSVVDAAAAVNAAGHSVVFLANYYDYSNTVNLVINGVPGTSDQVVEYLGTGTSTGASPTSTTSMPVSSGTLSTTLTMPAYSVIGLDLGALGNSGATATGQIGSAVSDTLCLDDQGGSSADGTKISLWGCNYTAAQSWTRDGDGTIRALGKCLDAYQNGTGNGTPIDLYTCNGGANQQWIPQADGALLNPASGKCLDDPDSSTAGGVQLQLYTCDGTNAQHWFLP
jgi:hypothetical protein